MSAIRFYLDENISPQIAAQLKQRGIDAITTKEIDQLGDDDRNHLE
jgi:predicted nuclease of predicted toxin-antitoxin system